MPSALSVESRVASPVSLGSDVPLVPENSGPNGSVVLGANGVPGNTAPPLALARDCANAKSANRVAGVISPSVLLKKIVVYYGAVECDTSSNSAVEFRRLKTR